MSDADESLLTFPCEYTIKVLGRAAPDLAVWVRTQIEQHVPCNAVAERPSGEGRFVSVNATFTAQSLDQLQRIHQQLRASERVSLIL